LAADNLKFELRAARRNLDQALRNYDISLKSAELNQRRVEEQDLRAELGRATAQDQVDAQNDLTNSQNSLTADLVGHYIARLEFWRDMGILYINENGRWEDVDEGTVQQVTDNTEQTEAADPKRM
jgi:outer membrane protein TolC